MNIGITGATGFLGSYLIKYLIENYSYQITALSRNAVNSDLSKVKWLIGDLSSEYDCKNFVENIDVLIHMAHNNSPLTSDNDIHSDAVLNLMPNLTLIETIKRANKKIHIIYLSSGGAIYGVSQNKIPLKESDLCMPVSSYGIQKLTIENYLRLWSCRGFITTTVLRVSNPYGILLPSNRKQGLIGVILNKAKHNEPIQIYGNANNIRDYIHLSDMCDAIEKAVHNKSEFDIFNIGTGQGYSVNEIISIIEYNSNSKLNCEYINNENSRNLIDWNVLDISKAQQILNWQPKADLPTGLKELINNF